MTTLDQAIAIVKAAGYRVSKPRATATRTTTAEPLNALGLPLSPLYDPKYRRRTSFTSISRLRAPQNFPMVKDTVQS